METSFFFKNKSYNLFGILHKPSESSFLNLASERFGFVFCHPFAEEKLIAHRITLNIARSLASAGFFCLRFDFMGHGDSDGNFEDSTVETRLSDIKCAVDFLKNQTDVEKVGLIGLRFGATLAVLASENILSLDTLILIAPIISGKAYINQCLRSNLTAQMMVYKRIVKNRKQLREDLLAGEPVNIDGYLLTTDFFRQIESINLTDISSSLQNILIIQVSRNQNQPFTDELTNFYEHYKSTSVRVELANVKEDFFWTDVKTYISESKPIQEMINQFLTH